MCSMNDDPSMYDEPMEDSIDWAHLRWMRVKREEHATEAERRHGIPEREGVIRREADRLRHSQARRGFEYHER